MLSMLELSLRAVHFRLISQGFCTLERYILFASPCDCVNSSFQDKYRQVCTMQTVYAACSLESSSWWRTANAGWWWFCNLLTCNNCMCECLFCVDYSLCFDSQPDARHLPQ